MRRIKSTTRGAAILFIVWSVTMAIGAAVAQEIVEVPIDTVVRGREGDVKLIDPPGVVSVPADKVGRQCSVHETSQNNTSVHPNNDLIVTSGGESVTLFDVESGSGIRVDGDGLLTLGETVQIEVRLGSDGVFSGGFIVGLCETEIRCGSPALSVGVTPGEQEVAAGGDASFDVTVTNTGDEDMVDVVVDSSVAACDNTIGALAVGGETSYACKSVGVVTDLNVSFTVTGEGVTQGALCSASDDANAVVGNPPPPTTTTTTTTPRTPTGVPTGTGDAGSPSVPVGALAVVGLALAVIGAGAYRVTRREH